MSTSRYIGRVGGLALALGVGAAAFAGGAIASAETSDGAATDPTGTSLSSSPDTSPARGVERSAPTRGVKRASAAKKAARGSSLGAAASNTSGAAQPSATLPESNPDDLQALPAALRGSRGVIGSDRLSSRTADAVRSLTAQLPAIARVYAPAASAASAAAFPVPAFPTQMSSAPTALASAVDPNALPPRVDFQTTWSLVVSSVIFGIVPQTIRALSAAIYLGPTRSTLNQTIVVNGYRLVPSSTEEVTSFYGPWSYFPGGSTMIQGKQQYDVIDPATDENLGTFDALVASGNPLNLGSRYVELLVTANDGVNVGTGPGQIPPVGSLIATFHLIGPFGWSYTAMPSGSGDLVSFKLLTPFGNIRLPMPFDAAKGLADGTVDNRPINLGNGYSIAPADPDGQEYVGISGFLPSFTAVQLAAQTFNVRDGEGNVVGTFEGVVTPTADVAGLYTQAILVTANDGNDIGTAAGQTPPVGSVFNVIYDGEDSRYALYSSLPAVSGDVVSVISVNGDKVSNIRTFPLNILNASSPPPVRRLPAGGGYAFLPTSDLVVSGVNGLPPREVQTQGYQQFAMFDSQGVQQGTFDADVFTQWDMYGIQTQTIIVTNVTDGTAGVARGEVPPAGSMFSYVYFGNTGLGTFYSAKPTPSGAKTSFKILTPLFNIPTWSTYNATAGFDTVSFFDPFTP